MYLLTCFVLSFCLLNTQSQGQQGARDFYNGAFINNDPNPIYFEGNFDRQSFANSKLVNQKIIRTGFGYEEQAKPVTAQEKNNVYNFDIQRTVEIDKQNKELSNKDQSHNTQTSLSQSLGVVDPVQNEKGADDNSNLPNAFDAVTNFGLNLFKQVNKLQSGNTVISPYSITMLLALLQQGAKETTLQQITNVLQLSTNTTTELYQKITDELESRNSRNVLRVANNIFVADAFNINSGFQRIARGNFKSAVTPMSFIRPELAAQNINNWIASKTDNKIDNLLSSDSLSENTQMVLVNAVYFKGLWQIPFRPESTLSRPFEIRRGVTKPASFMRTRRYFRTGVDSYTGAKVIILPFEYDQYSLMVILPSTLSDVDTELSSLTVSQLASYHKFPAKEVELELPKFTVKADTDLTPVFIKMGITNIFSQRSELYGLGTYRTSSPQITSALHSAVLSIDEKGGSAAAATSFAVVALSYDDASVKFIANRPFIAVLWDSATTLPLFMAKVEDPVI